MSDLADTLQRRLRLEPYIDRDTLEKLGSAATLFLAAIQRIPASAVDRELAVALAAYWYDQRGLLKIGGLVQCVPRRISDAVQAECLRQREVKSALTPKKGLSHE